ncbi:3161_t:CDS:2 [Diversispora eburnea]|uniref:3161_t:CDS:1 n=1 Tax=Diversispora eburnea TaxID=1213867 RepID=A0A9N9GEC5_9GLOM|nr:3161_t:CDS:2 [Diversispora eburnea]
MSKIDNEIWITVLNNTNVAEVAYALSNCREKNLKLITAIKQGYKLDKERLIAINNNNKYNILFCERDKANKLIKKVKTTFSICKQNENASSSKKKLKKTITIESDIEDNQNEDNQDQENTEFQEKVIALKECQLALKEREAKLREIELNNLIKEKELNN